MFTPTLSVIIPSFNCGNIICDAIDSTLRQTFNNFEIIVIDDGSTDDTRFKLKKYILTNKIIYFYQKNSGLPGARNSGIALSKGEYVFCLDADDELMPNALSELYASALRTGAGWVVSDLIRVEGNKTEIQKALLPGNEKLMDIFRKKWSFQARFYRKDVLDAIGRYDDQQKYYEDWELYIRLVEKNIPYSHVPLPLYIYKIRPQSITKQKNFKKNLYYIERIYRKHYQRFADKKNSEAASLYAYYMWQLASDYFHKTHCLSATLRCFLQSYKYDPTILYKYLQKCYKLILRTRPI